MLLHAVAAGFCFFLTFPAESQHCCTQTSWPVEGEADSAFQDSWILNIPLQTRSTASPFLLCRGPVNWGGMDGK